MGSRLDAGPARVLIEWIAMRAEGPRLPHFPGCSKYRASGGGWSLRVGIR